MKTCLTILLLICAATGYAQTVTDSDKHLIQNAEEVPLYYDSTNKDMIVTLTLRNVDDSHYPAYLILLGQNGDTGPVKKFRYNQGTYKNASVAEIKKLIGQQVLIRYRLRKGENEAIKITTP